MALPTLSQLTDLARASAQRIGVQLSDSQGSPVRSPILGSTLGGVTVDVGLDAAVQRAATAAVIWRSVPAPRRGEVIRVFGESLRANKHDLAVLVSIETGKVLSEGLGE